MNGDARPTVLIIDDDRANRTLLAELLAGECRILLAREGASGLEILAREDVALVLLDVSMPGMNGYEVLIRMRADPRHTDTGVIFITGMSEEADEERGLLMGAADYVQKPIRPAVLRARVKTQLKLAAQRRALEALALQDGLTGIANRRFFDEALDRSLRQGERSGQVLGIAILDVDHFKQFNDRYGHGAGDEALRQVARILGHFARRPGDVVARYGGEEFVLLLPGTADFPALLERLRQRVMDHGIVHEGSPTAAVLTISGGAVVLNPERHISGPDLLDWADRLLYQAKETGRNRICFECGAAAG